MMMSSEKRRSLIREFLTPRFSTSQMDVGDNGVRATDVLGSGRVEALGRFLESTFSIALRPGDLDPSTVCNIEQLEALVVRRRRDRWHELVDATTEKRVLLAPHYSDADWYRPERCTFHPTEDHLHGTAAEGIDPVLEYVLKGWTPQSPFIDSSMPICTIGSCFATHIVAYLLEHGYHVLGSAPLLQNIRAPVNTPAAMRQILSWVVEDEDAIEPIWYDDAEAVASIRDQHRARIRSAFDVADCFILTFGLSELWYDKQTKAVFLRAIPPSQFDPERQGFKVASFQETKRDIAAIVQILHRLRPQAPIVMSLSPIALKATFRRESCITANCVSKSILRAAIDEFYRDYGGGDTSGLYYWPAYEIVEKFCVDPYKPDERHLTPDATALVMREFMRHYLVPND